MTDRAAETANMLAVAKCMQGANAIRMMESHPWDSIAEQEKFHWLYLAEAAVTALRAAAGDKESGVNELPCPTCGWTGYGPKPTVAPPDPAEAGGDACADAVRTMAREFCEGAFGPFGVKIEPYTEVITELLMQARSLPPDPAEAGADTAAGEEDARVSPEQLQVKYGTAVPRTRI